MPGVVKLSCGAWYDPADDGDEPLCLHGNANVLTRDQGTSKLAQGPSSATALVEVERYTEPLRPVRAFAPPKDGGRGIAVARIALCRACPGRGAARSGAPLIRDPGCLP